MKKKNGFCRHLIKVLLLSSLIGCGTSGVVLPPPVGQNENDRCDLNINGKKQKEIQLKQVLPRLTFDNQGNIGSCYANSLSVALAAQAKNNRHSPVSYMDLMFLSPETRPLKKHKDQDVAFFEGGNTCTIFEEAKKKGYCEKDLSILEKAEGDKIISSLAKGQMLVPLLNYYHKLMELPQDERKKVINNVQSAYIRAQSMTADAKIDPKQVAIDDCERDGPYIGLSFLVPLLKLFIEKPERESLEKFFGPTDKSKSVEIQFFQEDVKNNLKSWYPNWLRVRQQKLNSNEFFKEFEKKTGLSLGMDKLNKNSAEMLNMISAIFLAMDSYYDEKVCNNAKALRELDRKSLARKTKDQLEACCEDQQVKNNIEAELSKALGVDSISLLSDELMKTVVNPKLEAFHADFQKIFLPECEGKRLPVEASRCEQFDQTEQILSEIASNRVVMATVEMGLFYADNPDEIRSKSREAVFSYHSVAIKGVRGQKSPSGECEPFFLVHNSWGGACAGTIGKLSTQFCNEATGEFWIPAKMLDLAKAPTGRFGPFIQHAPYQVLK